MPTFKSWKKVIYVCHCYGITDRRVAKAIDDGAQTVEDLTTECSAGGGCGRCRLLLQALIDVADSSQESEPSVV